MLANARLPGAPEILTLILASCESFAEVIAFASTCKEVYSVWKENAPPILDRLGPRCIPAFDEALVAYRALEIAKTAILNGKLPPKDINIAQLSAAVRIPQLSEMPGVTDLQRIVQFTERSYLHSCPMCRENGWACSPDHEESCGPQHLPPYDGWAPYCSVSFQRAVYRVLLAGPVLAGWYMEPFASGGVPNRLPLEFPKNLRWFLEQSDNVSETFYLEEVELHDEDMSYLERFIPFDQDANTRLSEKQDQLFRPLGDWLIQSMKDHISDDIRKWALGKHPAGYGTQELNLSGFRDGSAVEGVIILREVMRMQVAYESLAHALWNYDNKSAHGRWGNNEGPPAIPKDGVWKPLFIIVLGVYQLEQVQFEGEALIVTPIGRLPGVCSLGPVPEEAVDIFFLQEYLWAYSGRVNCIDRCVAAPPRVQLFAFLLHRYFGLGSSLGDTWSTSASKDEPYLDFLSNGLIFTNNTERWEYHGTGILSNFPPNPVFSFQQLSL